MPSPPGASTVGARDDHLARAGTLAARAALAALATWVLSTGCGAPQLLPTTLFHAPLGPDVTPTDADWLRLARAAAAGAADRVQVVAPIRADEWLVWTDDGVSRSAIARVRRTALGLEAQATGSHAGPAIRPTLRALVVGGTRIVVLESSLDAFSTERDAFLFVEQGSLIVPLTLDGSPGHLRVRAERVTSLEHGWYREATLTVTLEARADAVVAHEHVSVRELAADRPELPARSTYDVERQRLLRVSAAGLSSDRPSLLDEH